MAEVLSPERKSEWERYASYMEALMKEARGSYIKKQIEAGVDEQKAREAFAMAVYMYPFSVIKDEQVRAKLKGRDLGEKGVRAELTKHIAWHVLVGSTIPDPKLVPHRDVNKKQIENFFRRIVETGELPPVEAMM